MTSRIGAKDARHMNDLNSPGNPSRSGGPPLLRRVRLRNYKSIGECDVELGPVTILVGRNGAGKSNFLDALRFTADGLSTTLDQAVKSRGGIDSVRRKSTGHPRNFLVELGLMLSDYGSATYRFEIKAQRGGFAVKEERLQVNKPNGDLQAGFRRSDGSISIHGEEETPSVDPDRLFLVTASGRRELRVAYDALTSMGFYNLNPRVMKELQSPDPGELLSREGGNIASVVSRIASESPQLMSRIEEFLAEIVPGISGIQRVSLGPRETLEFRQRVAGSRDPWRFYAESMSDGTLRAFATLVAVTQLADRKRPVRMVGIEEPETALHPAASGALMDALREAATHTQVLITTHSPELLDHVDLGLDTLLVVEAVDGETQIAPADQASLEAVRDHLYTVGDLLRMGQLEPDPESVAKQKTLWESDEP